MKEALLAGWVYRYRKNYKQWIVSLCRSVYFLSTYFTPPPLKYWIKPRRIVTSLTEMRGFAVETWSNLAYSLSISQSLAFRLAILIFAKTRFCNHINFIGRCLHSKVIPKGFRSNFHASSLSRCNQYLRQIQCAQNSFSRNIMRITITILLEPKFRPRLFKGWITLFTG